jgi:hypothetical protein
MASLFNNKIVQNCHRLLSNNGLPKDVAYSAIKEQQIVITYLVKKIVPNCQQLLSDIRRPHG